MKFKVVAKEGITTQLVKGGKRQNIEYQEILKPTEPVIRIQRQIILNNMELKPTKARIHGEDSFINIKFIIETVKAVTRWIF